MQVPARHIRSAVSLCLSALLLINLPAFAALSGPDSQKLDQFEKTVFGKTREQLSEESRLRALEINLLGKSKNGSHSDRIAAIAKIMGAGPSAAKFLPPMAGSMDTSATAPSAVKPAPARPAQYEDSAMDSSVVSAPTSSDRAKEILRQALEKHGHGDVNGAEQLFKQALSIDPSNSDANFNLGAVLEDKGDLEGAIHCYQAAAKASPGDRDIQDALTGVRDKIRQTQVAQQTQREMQKKLQLKQLADKAAVAYKAGNYDQAISELDKIAAQSPDDPNVQYGLAQAWRGKGDLNRARNFLGRALAISPDNQLYRTTLNDLDRDLQKQIARGGPAAGNGGNPGYGNAGDPSSAPDYRNGRRSPMDDGMQSFDNTDIASSGSGYNPDGGVQPFTNQGEGRLYGHEVVNGIRNGGLGGLGGLGGIGMGALGALGGMGMSRMGGARYGGSGNRLVRGAVSGALSGAAVGALTNMRGPGGMKSGAMKGALYGGLFGLMTGF